MAMQGPRSEGDESIISEINITPMVDVMLVLLVIFMVTAPAIFTPAIEIDVPEAATGENVGEKEMSVLIDRDGKWYLNGKSIDREALQTEVRSYVKSGKDPVVLVGADQQTAHREVISVLDLLRAEGVTKFAINTAPPAPAPNP